MKVGNIIGGLEVVDVKRINKLNLIQFLKEVDSYLQQGYQIDVASGRQVGLVLQTDMFKTEQPFGGVGSVGGVDSVEPELETEKVEETSVEETVAEDVSVTEATEQSVEAAVKEEALVAPKKTTTRSKKTAQ